MSEHEENNSIEQPTQDSEQSIDVTSLKKIDMSVTDYGKYADLYPDDLELAELYERYDITPGEPIIVSATDPEQPEKNVLLVVATGEDAFTTNRSLTNELEARLHDVDDSAERSAPRDDIKELGGQALEAAGIEEPNVAPDHATSERDLMEAKKVFEERVGRLSTEYAGTSNRYKNEVKTNAESLSVLRNKLENSSETALRYLRSGVEQPDRIRQVVNLAIEELTGVNRVLGNVLETVEDSRTANGNLGSQAEAHNNDVGRLRGEFRTEMGRIADEASEPDDETLGRADAEVTEMVVRRTVSTSSLKEAVLEIGTALSQVDDDVDATRRRTRNLLGRLEDVQVSISRGRFNSSEYEGVVRSASVLARELQDSTTIRRFVALAKGL